MLSLVSWRYLCRGVKRVDEQNSSEVKDRGFPRHRELGVMRMQVVIKLQEGLRTARDSMYSAKNIA